MQVSSVTIALARSIIYFAAARGASLPALCAAAGITPEQLDMPDHRIAGEQTRRAWQMAVAQTGDADFGLHLGEHTEPAVLGLVGYVMLSSPDLRRAFEKLLRYTDLLTDGVRGQLECRRGRAHIDLHIADDVDNYLHTDPRHAIESTAATVVALTRALTGRALPVTAMAFQHAAPPHVAEHRRIFGVPVTFGAAVTRLSFAEAALGWPVVHTHPALLAAFEAEAEAALARIDGDQSWSARARRATADQLKGELPSVAAVARALKVSPRSLQRLLAEEKTSFRAVLDHVRCSLAQRYLGRPQTSLTEIAFLLGFSEPSVFHRSFKRWTGRTPQQFRASLARPPRPAT
jgi:AraC-like DNA-binding protein